MGLNSVINPPDPQKKSGGLFSKITGGLGALATIGGYAAAPFTGGASIPIGLGVGAALGAASTVGNIIDPQTVSGGGSKPGVPQMSAADRRLQSDPQATLAQLNQSLAAIQSMDEKTRNTYQPFLVAAKEQAQGGMG